VSESEVWNLRLKNLDSVRKTIIDSASLTAAFSTRQRANVLRQPEGRRLPRQRLWSADSFTALWWLNWQSVEGGSGRDDN